MSKKSYCVDTSVLIDNPKSIEILRNGSENDIYLSAETIEELDGLKKNPRISHIIKEVTDELIKFQNEIIVIDYKSTSKKDNKILNDMVSFLQENKDLGEPFIFVTNDRILKFKAIKLGIETQDFKDSHPYKSESQLYTGFIDINTETYINNCFYWVDGKLKYWDSSKEKAIDYENAIWTVKPKTPYQNAAMELLLNEKLDLVSIQSSAGYGKTFIALATALYWVLEKKKFKKIFILKHHIDVGSEKLGFLPGNVDEKVEPYARAIHDLVLKLHDLRPANKLFHDPKAPDLEFNKKFFEFLPLNYIRGMNIDNAFVIVDECQNFSRQEMKVILSRMGENVRVVCLGDVEQIDAPILNESNNGLNWTVRAFKGQPTYGHIVLKGKNSRGPIADMVRNSIL
jgi:PhoH-like ATPase